jgi:predicted phage terminase large subunit-like protein
VVKEHLDIDGTVAAILRMRSQHPQATVVIEEAANGSAAIMHLQRVRGIGNVVAVKSLGGKMSRFQAMCPEWAAHDWLVPRNLLWVEPFLAQLMSFPAAKNDDMADACSQAASWLLQANQQYGLFITRSAERKFPAATGDQPAPGQPAPPFYRNHTKYVVGTSTADHPIRHACAYKNIVMVRGRRKPAVSGRACSSCCCNHVQRARRIQTAVFRDSYVGTAPANNY